MAIDPQFSIHQFQALMEAIPKVMGEEIIRAFSYLGERCIARIRNRPGTESWNDISGNLRSSIGYAVYEYGKTAIESAFNQVLSGSEGSEQGRKAIEELASKYAETYALVVVAGMDYAGYVEAKENKDVLASTDLWARQQVDSYLQRAVERAYSRITRMKNQLGL